MMKVLPPPAQGNDSQGDKNYAKSNGLGTFLRRMDESIQKSVSEEKEPGHNSSNTVCE